MIKKILSIGLATLTVSLVGCSFQDTVTVSNMFEYFENNSKTEGNLLSNKKLVEIKEEEKVVFQQIMELDSTKVDEQEKLIKKATDLAKQRLELVKKEKEISEQSFKEFDNVKNLSNRLQNDKIVKKYKDTEKIILERHKTYKEIYDLYLETTELEVKLYESLQKDKLDNKVLANQINKINENYKSIQEKTVIFNDLTKQYNENRKELYKIAEVTVKQN